MVDGEDNEWDDVPDNLFPEILRVASRMKGELGSVRFCQSLHKSKLKTIGVVYQATTFYSSNPLKHQFPSPRN